VTDGTHGGTHDGTAGKQERNKSERPTMGGVRISPESGVAKTSSGVVMERSSKGTFVFYVTSFVAVPKGGRTWSAFYRRG
jgi:hypothetical protein